VTGLGAVSPLANDFLGTWSALKTGSSGIGPVTSFDPSPFPTRIAAEVRGFDPARWMEPAEAAQLDRFAQFAVAAAVEAAAQARLTGLDPERTGAVIGSGKGGFASFEAAHSAFLAGKKFEPGALMKIAIGSASTAVAARFGLSGPVSAVTAACASGAVAIEAAFRIIQRGDADVMLAGGAEASITPFGFAGFCAMGAMTLRNQDGPRASRPYDWARDGFVMGEGGAVLVLESLESARARGARVLAELAGCGLSADATHLTAPDPDGAGLALAIRLALADSGLAPEDVDYINSHGTSTVLNDRAETAAIKRALGGHARRTAISSTKSMTGHLLGAAGALEAAVTVMALADGFVPPTINLTDPDPACDLDYTPGRGRNAPLAAALSLSAGFGGHNAVLAFRKAG
jgi:3-oxoacyl-[acyl-carrier-protein] synthase II